MTLDKVCESNVADDEKLANVAKKVKKKPVFKSHGKKKSETPAVDAPLIHTERDDVELWFKLGNKVVHFGIEEFSLITGLDCKKSYDVDLFKSKKLLGYKEDIFCMHGLTVKVTVRKVASVFFSGALKDDEDYVKIALIALKDGNDTFEQLPKKRMIEKGYKLKGFPIAFLIWLYEIIPSLSPRFCKRIGNKSPRVLNWEYSPTSEFSKLIQDVFNNPKIVIKDFVALSGEKSQSIFSKFKFDPQYIPKRVGDVVCSDEVNDEVKAYYQDISDDGGGLQLSVHTGQAVEENDTLNFENMFIDPDFLKGVVDSTVNSALKTNDVSFHDDSDKPSLVFVKKYSDADNMLSPPMDFSFIKIFEKMWFYKLHACDEFLCDSHLDVVFYYLRKKIEQDDTLNQRITTTDCLFDQVIWNSYNQFLKSGSNPSKIDFDNVIPRYIVGEYLFCNTPWVLTDHVLIYVNIQKQQYWILVHFDIKERMLNVYNSMSGALNKKRALDHVKAYSTMLPYYLEYLDVYSSKSDLNLIEGPYSVGKREPLNFKFIDGLPSQFADFFIHGKIDDIPSKMSDLVAVYRDDLAVSLFIHARRKQIGGYITDDEVLKKVKKSKDNASDKAKVKAKDIAKGKGKEK
ncbi:hypothetical protein G4B88_028128 [Cannabis sativa]|uniref:Ubiquitin-like protease family profile domain-containing protein n=1 Tax=Cannabis sativa TaxID=3483 RepID=A0A7J6HUP0_CANSA|nr:hypothetical protein G4B88_028128 [Cannabis sativa]